MMDLPKRGAPDVDIDVEEVPESSEADRIANSVLTSLGEAEPEAEGEGADIAPQVEIVDKEIFYSTLFRPAFTGMALATRVPEAKISKEEEPAAREASDDLYDLLEVWYPSALNPQTGTFKKLCTVGGFLFYKLQVIREAMKERRLAALGEPQEPEPTPDAPAPEFASVRTQQFDDWGGGAVPS